MIARCFIIFLLCGFGTYDGLNRFDGYSFKIFRNVIGDTASLINNHITTIGEDVNRNLWVGLRDGIEHLRFAMDTAARKLKQF